MPVVIAFDASGQRLSRFGAWLFIMASIADRLPRNTLRIFTTPEDVMRGVWNLWCQAKIANLQWELCDERRCETAFDNDDGGRAC